MEKYLEQAQQLIDLYGWKVLGAIAILIIGRIVAGVLRGTIRKVMSKSKVDDMLVKFVASLAYIGLMAFVIIAALERVGIDSSSFVVVLGAAGFAVGMALKGSLGNFASGVMMIIFKPFKLGDYIEAGGTSGVVEEIGIFATVLKTPDNKKVIVPNEGVTSGNITNYSANDTRRVDMVACVSYNDNLDTVRKILEEIVAADERVLKDPGVTIAVLELADSSVNFAVRPWVKTVDYWDVYFNMQETIKKRFDAEGISIPFPQQEVHMHQVQ